MAGGGSEEKKLLCCFVVDSKDFYDFYALDFYKLDSGKVDDQKYGVVVGGGYQNCELGVGGDDQKYGLSEGNDDLKYKLFRDDNLTHLPRLPDPILTIPRKDGYPQHMAFGLLDGMLYMVSPNKEVYVFDTRHITTTTSSSCLDHKVCVTRGPTLNGLKADPVVIPLAGKLFVFARRFYPDKKAGDTEHVIEVLDPEKNKYWSPIKLPERVFDFAEEKISKGSERALLKGYKMGVWNTFLTLRSHATVGSSIVLCWSLDCYGTKYELSVLDAETLSWKLRVDHLHMNIGFLSTWGSCLYWDGIWCSQIAFTGMIMNLEGGSSLEEDSLRIHLPSKHVSRTTGKVVRVDDTTLLVFSNGMKRERHIKTCSNYFKLDMVRVDKRKRDIDGVQKLTASLVESKEFFVNKYNSRFKLSCCFSLSY